MCTEAVAMKERSVSLDGAEVQIEGMKVRVKGPKGEIERDFGFPELRGLIEISVDGDRVVVRPKSGRRKVLAMAGTIVAHIRNMVIGVTKGYKYVMKIHYVHFPMTVEVKGDEVIIKNFLGERGVRKAKIRPGVKVEVNGQDVIVTGISKEDVGLTVSNIERATTIGRKDRRVFQDGIYLAERMVIG